MNTLQFSKNLKKLRKKAKLSQVELSSQTGFANNRVSYLENSMRQPSLVDVVNLCRVLSVTPNELLYRCGWEK